MVFDAKEWLSKLGEDENAAINAIVAKHKGEAEKTSAETLSKLGVEKAELAKQLELLRTEKTTLSTKLEEGTKANMTAEEKRTAEIATIREELASIKTERDNIAKQRQSDMITSVITKEVAKYSPNNIDDVVSLLRPQCEVSDGNVTISDKTVEEAVKAVKDSPERGYLFKGAVIQGSGSKPTGGTSVEKTDLDKEIEAMIT